VVDKGALTDAMFREKKDLNAVLDGHAIHQFIQNMEKESLATDVATPDDASILAQVKKLLFGKKEEPKVEMADANTQHIVTKALQNKISALEAEKLQLSTDKTNLQTQLTGAQKEIAQLQKEKADLEALNAELGKIAPKMGEVKANVGDAAVTTLASHPAQIKFIAHLQNI
jgi:chromosome segregation ATPase